MVKNKNSLFKKFIESLSYVRESRRFIYFAIIIFILFILIGLIIPTPLFIRQLIQDALKKIVLQTEGLSLIELVGFILWNNFSVSAIAILLGFTFAFIPFLMAVSNGYILGFVFRSLIERLGIIDGGLSFWKILPHGIFEIPAIMVSLGIGIRLGVLFFNGLNKNSLKEFKINFRKAIFVLFLVILPLLVVAAIIESALITFLT